jgi:hypothetical protein
MNAPFKPPAVRNKIDPRLAFLARAAALFELVEAGEMDIDEAFDSLVACLQCSCSRELVQKWERDYPTRRAKPVSKTEFLK